VGGKRANRGIPTQIDVLLGERRRICWPLDAERWQVWKANPKQVRNKEGRDLFIRQSQSGKKVEAPPRKERRVERNKAKKTAAKERIGGGWPFTD